MARSSLFYEKFKIIVQEMELRCTMPRGSERLRQSMIPNRPASPTGHGVEQSETVSLTMVHPHDEFENVVVSCHEGEWDTGFEQNV